jgi:hypothetical protein
MRIKHSIYYHFKEYINERRIILVIFNIKMDNDEVEFIAENELITIVPNFQYKTLYLIGVSLK